MLCGLEIDDSNIGKCSITEVSSIEGEAVANNRKGKLIFFYEWLIKCNWKGNLNGDSDEFSGKLEIPNLSEENSADEINLDVTLDAPGPKADILKELVRTKGLLLVQKQIQKYILALRDEFAIDMIKPTKFSDEGTINSFHTEDQLKKNNSTFSSAIVSTSSKPKPQTNSVGLKIETCQVNLRDSFKCTADELFRVFTDSNLLEAFTQTKAISDVTVGGKFSLLGDNIKGTYLQLDQPKCIKQQWRIKSWPAEHFSEVTINIEQKTDTTEITLVQTGVPYTEHDRTEDGWRRHYFDSIKRIFGFGSAIF